MNINRVDLLTMSHVDEDHCSVNFIKALISKFPQLPIVCNGKVEGHLAEKGVQTKFRGETTACVRGFHAQHRHIESVEL